MTDLEKLKALIDAGKKATKGEVVADNLCTENQATIRVGTTDGTELYYHYSATLCEMWKHDFHEERSEGEPFIDILQAEANARFFALSLNARPALSNTISYVEKLEEALEICIMNIENFGYENDLFAHAYNTAKQALAEKG